MSTNNTEQGQYPEQHIMEELEEERYTTGNVNEVAKAPSPSRNINSQRPTDPETQLFQDSNWKPASEADLTLDQLLDDETYTFQNICFDSSPAANPTAFKGIESTDNPLTYQNDQQHRQSQILQEHNSIVPVLFGESSHRPEKRGILREDESAANITMSNDFFRQYTHDEDYIPVSHHKVPKMDTDEDSTRADTVQATILNTQGSIHDKNRLNTSDLINRTEQWVAPPNTAFLPLQTGHSHMSSDVVPGQGLTVLPSAFHHQPSNISYSHTSNNAPLSTLKALLDGKQDRSIVAENPQLRFPRTPEEVHLQTPSPLVAAVPRSRAGSRVVKQESAAALPDKSISRPTLYQSIEDEPSPIIAQYNPRSRKQVEMSTSRQHLPADSTIDPEPRTIGSGQNLMAQFGSDPESRTKYSLKVERGRRGRHAKDPYAQSDQILPAKLSLAEICTYYPNHVWGTMLRVFHCEGWDAEKIWTCLPPSCRHNMAKERPWNYLQQAIGREIDRVHEEQTGEKRVPIKRKPRLAEDDDEDGGPSDRFKRQRTEVPRFESPARFEEFGQRTLNQSNQLDRFDRISPFQTQVDHHSLYNTNSSSSNMPQSYANNFGLTSGGPLYSYQTMPSNNFVPSTMFSQPVAPSMSYSTQSQPNLVPPGTSFRPQSMLLREQLEHHIKQLIKGCLAYETSFADTGPHIQIMRVEAIWRRFNERWRVCFCERQPNPQVGQGIHDSYQLLLKYTEHELRPLQNLENVQSWAARVHHEASRKYLNLLQGWRQQWATRLRERQARVGFGLPAQVSPMMATPHSYIGSVPTGYGSPTPQHPPGIAPLAAQAQYPFQNRLPGNHRAFDGAFSASTSPGQGQEQGQESSKQSQSAPEEINMSFGPLAYDFGDPNDDTSPFSSIFDFDTNTPESDGIGNVNEKSLSSSESTKDEAQTTVAEVNANLFTNNPEESEMTASDVFYSADSLVTENIRADETTAASPPGDVEIGELVEYVIDKNQKRKSSPTPPANQKRKLPTSEEIAAQRRQQKIDDNLFHDHDIKFFREQFLECKRVSGEDISKYHDESGNVKVTEDDLRRWMQCGKDEIDTATQSAREKRRKGNGF